MPREKLWLQTKFTALRGQDPRRVPYDPKAQGGAQLVAGRVASRCQAPLAQQVEQSIGRSLRNLGTTYLDSLVMHSPMPTLEENLEVPQILMIFDVIWVVGSCHKV